MTVSRQTLTKHLEKMFNPIFKWLKIKILFMSSVF